jgi:hypothetical protein
MFANWQLATTKIIVFLPIYLGLVFVCHSSTLAALSLKIIEYPSEVKIDSPFTLKIGVSGLEAGKTFSYKVGVTPPEPTSYSYGQVKNGDQWVGYQASGSCDEGVAPTATSNEDGLWEGEITAKVFRGKDSNNETKAGDGKIRFKLCDPDKASSSYDIKLLEADKLPDPPPKPKPDPPTPKVEEIKEPEPTPDPEPPPTETTQSDDSSQGNVDETIPAPKVSYQPPIPKIERKLPATLSAVPAVLGQNMGSPSSDEATSTATPSASPSATTNTQNRNFIFLIAGATLVILTAIAGTLWYYKTNGSARN